jgi:hypothetical protein
MHKTTRKLIDSYGGFAVEDLSLKGLMRTRLAGSLSALRRNHCPQWAGICTETCPAGVYLRNERHYHGPIPATLGYLAPRGEYPPAMVASFGLCPEVELSPISSH